MTTILQGGTEMSKRIMRSEEQRHVLAILDEIYLCVKKLKGATESGIVLEEGTTLLNEDHLNLKSGELLEAMKIYKRLVSRQQ